MSVPFIIDVQGGSVPGYSHLYRSDGIPETIGHQDSLGHRIINEGLIMGVFDGCSSTPDAGTGAGILARLTLSAMEQGFRSSMELRKEPEIACPYLNRYLITSMQRIAALLRSDNPDQAI